MEIARQEGRVTVDGLAARLGVTAQTIRRDLAELDEAGHLERVHGGAILRSGTVNIAYQERAALFADEKRRIAERCARDIPDGAALFLSIGTTTEAIAKNLRRHKGLMVVTNNLTVAHILSDVQDCRVILTGGTLRQADNGLTGPLAEATLAQFSLDLAVIGCSAVDGQGDVLDYDLAEIALNRLALSRARKTWLAVDHSKLSRSAPGCVTSLKTLDRIITDKALPTPLQAACAEWKTTVLIAD